MERNSRKILARLKADGWVLAGAEGSHHKLKHPVSGKTIIVPHPKKDLPTGTARSIAKFAGWLQE
ncbi:MAG: type II toxin-antitoxin system HicA family toxin [Hyphomicrobium sp.]